VNSFLNQDQYKLSMQEMVVRHFPDVEVEYEFINRGNTAFPPDFANRLRKTIEGWAETRFLTTHQSKMLKYYCPFLSSAFLTYLQGYRFNPNEVEATQNLGEFKLRIKGPWHKTILWEVPLLAAKSPAIVRGARCATRTLVFVLNASGRQTAKAANSVPTTGVCARALLVRVEALRVALELEVALEAAPGVTARAVAVASSPAEPEE